LFFRGIGALEIVRNGSNYFNGDLQSEGGNGTGFVGVFDANGSGEIVGLIITQTIKQRHSINKSVSKSVCHKVFFCSPLIPYPSLSHKHKNAGKGNYCQCWRVFFLRSCTCIGLQWHIFPYGEVYYGNINWKWLVLRQKSWIKYLSNKETCPTKSFLWNNFKKTHTFSVAGGGGYVDGDLFPEGGEGTGALVQFQTDVSGQIVKTLFKNVDHHGKNFIDDPYVNIFFRSSRYNQTSSITWVEILASGTGYISGNVTVFSTTGSGFLGSTLVDQYSGLE